ncbi:MAG: twin-arginine translocation pathway signal protein [Hydrogenophaga sp.]|uniref:Acg family FMN-binding oxidoreductase n=1 Tax=Hydrogenophaga sp. TaxID=1904254 RepID=UPI0016B81E88|nr:twin-arginine translocation pathway signal protein [Hydrogenophaga sp.]NIM40067.1 twin-arginine translocation pathway signal protein [Hydrogenophaga sp.]NIN25263.1 twin-arginine translocation pathway signal protein [Hydrogenophaga sp.]NIN29830.1 twin-arginine translocation pathway signal protein [Hydrogenophaga sp.]NIN54302.1 twin-arginine translocation pathway signal protein [Hydrogenophaga sp.]NIO50715.1 twin-arginine translocation pathway signal protein [Hydrogenophaga sp.]
MHRRSLLRLAGGGAIAAATAGLPGCSSALPDEAIAAWKGPGEETDPRRWALSFALLAPHSHNLQSWLVDLSVPEEITLFIDRTRLLPETDPFSRQMLMSQGSFIELLDQAARQKGLRAQIDLFPEGAFGPASVDARPTARIRLVPDASVRPDPLFAQVLHRRTNREAYDARVPGATEREAIAHSASAYPFRTGFVTADEADAIAHQRRIAKEAWRIELTTPRTVLESFKVLRVGPREIAQHRDGLSVNDPLVRVVTALGLFDRSVAPAPGDRAVQGQIDDFNAKIDTTPAFYWLVTEGNDRVTQVNAGRAWVRAQLAATAQGLSMQPISQALQEYPEMGALYREVHERLQASAPRFTVQMWARLGHAPAVQPAPRRGLAAHILRA